MVHREDSMDDGSHEGFVGDVIGWVRVGPTSVAAWYHFTVSVAYLNVCQS